MCITWLLNFAASEMRPELQYFMQKFSEVCSSHWCKCYLCINYYYLKKFTNQIFYYYYFSLERERHMLRIWRRAVKHALTVVVMWVCILRSPSASMWTPRSRTDLVGETTRSQTRMVPVGSRCWRRWDAHHSISVFEWFSCAQLARSHWDASSMLATN